jgi:hypothetical protein
MKTMVENLFTQLQEYLNQDGNLLILDIDGKTGTKKCQLNYSTGTTTLSNLGSFHLRWGFGGDTHIRI